jgi:transposase
MLPEARLCSETSGQLRRLLKVRTAVVVKNQIHALLTAIGIADEKASLQSKKGRQRVLDALNGRENGPVGPAVRVQPLFETIEKLEENVKRIEAELEKLTEKDAAAELLLTIPGCGKIGARTIRAYTGDIKRFASAKKYAACAGLAPRVQNSNETVHHGRITKRGPEELRTALVQVVLGMRRSKKQTLAWRLMARYEALKPAKGSGKSMCKTLVLLPRPPGKRRR